MQTGYSDNVKPGAGVENNNVQPEQELNSDIQPIDTTSSPDCINANVVCSQMSDEDQNEWSAQSWLFREFLDKMKRNNVRSLLVYTEDNEGNPCKFEWMMPKKMKKETIEFISS